MDLDQRAHHLLRQPPAGGKAQHRPGQHVLGLSLCLLEQAEILLHQSSQRAHRVGSVQRHLPSVRARDVLAVAHKTVGQMREHDVQQLVGRRARALRERQHRLAIVVEQMSAGRHLPGIGLVDEQPVGHGDGADIGQRPRGREIKGKALLQDHSKGLAPLPVRRKTRQRGAQRKAAREGPAPLDLLCSEAKAQPRARPRAFHASGRVMAASASFTASPTRNGVRPHSRIGLSQP